MRHLVLAVLLALPSLVSAQTPFDNLRFRSVGPAVFGGRMHDVEAVPDDPSTVWVAAASGGVWKSTNAGTTWTAVFDQGDANAMGDIAIFHPNPDIVWLGTGEQNNRQSSTWGNGVYKTIDGGKTWQHLGLEGTRAIGRVRLHPSNPDVAYIAALGNLWKASPDRGVYKTTDGGKTWTKALFVDTLTGVVDLVMDPSNPEVLYAAAYQRLRTPWGFNGGGAGSGIYKTTDGGATWTKLTKGLPAGDKGRIGLAVAETYPRLVMATVEATGGEGGTYRSEDAGENWVKVSNTNPRPMYYSHIYIDPTNERRVWVLGVGIFFSSDGGRTFRDIANSPTYDVGLKTDNHAIWINPKNPKQMYLAGDGGLHASWDLGLHWKRINNIPVGQFYAIDADHRDPYWLYGGLQDNHSWMGPSATRHWLGIVNTDWLQIGFGDGMYQQADRFNPRWVYTSGQNGSIFRLDIENGDRLGIRPTPAPGDSAYRWDWSAPIYASRHTRGTVYIAGNRFFTSRDFGLTWTASKDLTRQVNRDTLRIMGVLGRDIALSRYDGESNFSEVTTIHESPVDPRVLWAGVDDGNLQVSRDGGATWTEVSGNVAGVPNGTFVSRVFASSAGPGVAYATFDGHRWGDFAPYVYRTTDYGRTWTKRTTGIADGHAVRTIHEFPNNPAVVFVGTERALYVSTDTAKSWRRLMANLPTTIYADIQVHARTKDLILGTHGRSIWILDDASPIAGYTPAVAAKPVHLFPIRQATAFHYWEDFSNWAQGEYAAENPPDGAMLYYSLAQAVPSVTITVTAPNGRRVRTLQGPGTAGTIHRVMWDLRHEAASVVTAGFIMPQVPGGRGGRGGRGGGGGGGGDFEGMFGAPTFNTTPIPHDIGERGPFAAPGTYTVTLEAGGTRVTESVRVLPDPKLALTVAEHRDREAFLLGIHDMLREMTDLSKAIAQLRQELTTRGQAGAGALQRLAAVEQSFVTGVVVNRGRLTQLLGGFNGTGAQQGTMYPPTPPMRAVAREARVALDKVKGEFQAIAP